MDVEPAFGHMYPGGHVLHEVMFISFWYVPGRQIVWNRLPSLPLGQAEPGGQTNHEVALQV